MVDPRAGRLLGAAVTGSVQLRVGDGVFNRLLWATPDGAVAHYDKRHLFRYAREHERYAAGSERLTVEWKGWKICPMVCYDLRFPVFSRNRYNVERKDQLDYDLLLSVANGRRRARTPGRRCYARARSRIVYVDGLNRVGDDARLHYAAIVR